MPKSAAVRRMPCMCPTSNDWCSSPLRCTVDVAGLETFPNLDRYMSDPNAPGLVTDPLPEEAPARECPAAGTVLAYRLYELVPCTPSAPTDAHDCVISGRLGYVLAVPSVWVAMQPLAAADARSVLGQPVPLLTAFQEQILARVSFNTERFMLTLCPNKVWRLLPRENGVQIDLSW